MKKVKGLRSTNWQLQNSHGDVKHSIGNIVNNILLTIWCQVGSRLTGRSLRKLYKCLAMPRVAQLTVVSPRSQRVVGSVSHQGTYVGFS